MRHAGRMIVGLLVLGQLAVVVQSKGGELPLLHREALAAQYFGADAPWFERNIPFLEIDDPEIQEIYYYRWKLFRSHMREIGPQGTTVVEFLDNVPWARDVPGQRVAFGGLIANSETKIVFPSLHAQELRIVLRGPVAPAVLRLVEVEAFAP